MASIIVFLLSLPLCTPGGYYVIAFLDYITVAILNNLMAVIMLIAMMWIYGVGKFMEFLSVAIGCRVNSWMIRFWRVYAVLLPGVFIILLVVGI